MSKPLANPRRVFGPCDRIAVLLPLPLAGAYDYRIPEEMTLGEGDVVEVPLGRRVEIGVVWGAALGDVPPAKIKDVRRRLDAPPFTEVARTFLAWVSDYTLSPLGAVMKMALSTPAALEAPKSQIAYALGTMPEGLRVTEARRRILEFLAHAPPMSAQDIAFEAGVGVAAVKALADTGALIPVPTPPPSPFPCPNPDHPGPDLSPDQTAAANALTERVRAGAFSATLLEGVTGSGKTEVYFEAMAEALRHGGQVLVLVPEIALTSQWLARFEARFGCPPAPWHSDLPQGARRKTWRAVAEGGARVVVGARSALFLPFTQLGLIVVDEEHEAAFKQEEGAIYHARDMAVVRASLGKIPIILASATPSLETVLNAKAGRYGHVILPQRHGGASLPEVALIDVRREPPVKGAWGVSWISPPLVAEVERVLGEGRQALLFLNRRGYAPLTLCRRCGHRFNCPHCTAWLVEHRRLGRLQCHHCGYSTPIPKACPTCEAEDELAACGPGVERLWEEARGRWPEARIAVAASDTVSGPAAAAELIRAITAHEVDLVIGTQMLAKGHHFPRLTLAGVVDADIGLNGGDLRAAERTFQLLFQVAGRTGRAAEAGKVLIQTADPTHPVMQALAHGDLKEFLEAEESQRRAAALPPFGRLAALIVSSTDPKACDASARALSRAAPRAAGLQVLGPAPAPLSLLRGRHRQRLLLKTPKEVRIQAVLRDWLGRVQLPNAVRVQVDVDPYSFL